MNLLNNAVKEEVLIDNLLNVKNNDNMFEKLTTLQNEVSVGFNTKVIAITSIKNDKLAGAFSKALADAYNLNGSSTLIIDANLYNPCLEEALGLKGKESDSVAITDNALSGSIRLVELDKKAGIVCLDKQIYPSDVYKNKVIHKLINENKDKYEHIVVLVPSVKKHKEVTLLKDVIDSILLVTQRDINKKEEIYNALCFFNEAGLPIAKTIILK